ncbi:hypothetical protein HDV00_003612 [Rhizophlyctis rosea]|nr:hypothetical protein HDV00_003612 [Rhizophlyctis rosea]
MSKRDLQKIAVAESLTGGMVSSKIVSRSGSSAYYEGGVVTYSLAAKVNQLNVDEDLARATNCVSGDVAAQMAKGVCNLFQTDVGVATTGYAEKCGEHHQQAYVALYRKADLLSVVRFIMVDEDKGPPASRNDFRARVTDLALGLLNQHAEI